MSKCTAQSVKYQTKMKLGRKEGSWGHRNLIPSEMAFIEGITTALKTARTEIGWRKIVALDLV